MVYKDVTPPKGGKISIKDGKLKVPDNPVVPFIRGDGTGPDIWAASVRVFDEAVKHTQAIGIAETDPGNDIDGWDSSVKVCVLANVLMGADLRPTQVDRLGIRAITVEMIKAAQLNRRKWRLMCSADWQDGQLMAKVAPEEVSANDPFFRLYGAASAIQLKTDTLNRLTLFETAPTPAQTAFGVLADLISAARGHF